MKTAVILFSILILFLEAAAAETQIFSGTVITDTNKVIDGGIFRFSYDEASNKLFVQTPATALIVENGACKSSSVYRVCINRANFSYKNITTYQYYYEIDTTVYKLTGSLSTNVAITSSTLLQGESAEFTITITNPTDFDINNVIYKETLTPFIVKEVKGCTLDGAQMVWQGSLQSKYDKTCTATIIAEKEGKYDLAGSLSYFNSLETEKIATNSVTITVLPKQLKTIQSIDDHIELKQPFYVNVSLQNINNEENIDLSATIEIPSNINILKIEPDFNKDINILKRSLTLEHGSFFNYSLYLKALSPSENSIRQKFDYSIKDIRDVIENDTFLNPLEPKPIIDLSTEYAQLIPGQKFIVVVKLKNPSIFSELTDIKAKLDAAYNNEIMQNISKLMPNESYTIISNTLISPKDISAEAIQLNLSVEYKFDGATKSENKSLELKINSSNGSVPAVVATKDNVQNPKEKKIEATVAETQSKNKTTEKAIIAEKPKSGFIKQILLTVALIIILFLIVLFIINRARKKGKKESEENLIKQLKESLPK